jgi:VWFA-related protein
MQFVTTKMRSVTLFLALVPVLASAQDVVFRTSVDLVTVDATVLDGSGKPVDSLTADDFALRVDGQPRRILSAYFVSQHTGGREQRSLFARHFSSNEQADAGRLMVVAVDEAHIRRLEGRAALNAAARFLDSLDPLDRVAVTGLSRLDSIQFTRDRAALKQRLTSLTGGTDPVFLQFKLGLSEATEVADGSRSRLAELVLRECGRALSDYRSPARSAEDSSGAGRDACPEQLEQEARAISQHARTQARISLASLQALVESLKRMDGVKTIVLLSEGMLLDPRLVDVSELSAQAKDARVAIYVLHMETPMFEAAEDRPSPTFLRDVQLRGDGLARVAGATRGAVFRLAGSDPAPFERINTELSGYYLLAFEPTVRDRDGKVHRIEVSLTRGTGLIRARSAFRMPVAAPTARSRQEELVGLLRGARVSAELPIRVSTYTYAADAGRLRVVVSAETDAAEGPAAQVLIGYVLTNSSGVIAASGAQLTSGGRYAFSTLVPPGTYALRVAALDPLDRRGVVERPFAAAIESFKGLRVSDLILAPPANPGEPLHPLVHHASGPRLVANLEIYPAAAPPEGLQVVVEIAREGGSTQHSVVADVVDRQPGLVVVRAALTTDSLATGDYVVHARVMVAGQEVARVMRPFEYRGR